MRTPRAAAAVRISFQEELDRLGSAIDEEGGLVLRALRAALSALEAHDLALADEVIAFDDEIDRRYVEIERGIESLLARQTPVAVDLRLVLAMLHINLHLERMGDYCVTVAKLLKLSEGLTEERRLLESIAEMGDRCEEMIRVALGSFAARDIEAATSLVELDELVDRVNRRAVHRILELAGDPSAHEWGLRMLIASRCLERIGDHAVDIGEQTAYLVSGEFREFTDASRPESALGG
ncbi:MAG TPA: phosphate signaling complex protein PhoU [Gaiellaceae bacterium]|nr:phosphate signaling complex protein PhoU [Gaiellaceae bacterium]HZT53822.1 phosphate signaling complex protein PhoU [Gaiellaceae bacterium]